MADETEHQFWYNMHTGEVEEGMVSPSVNRVGPFATREAAAHALDTLRANSAKWAAEDAKDDR